MALIHIKNANMLPDKIWMKAEDLSLCDDVIALLMQFFEDDRAILPNEPLFKMKLPWTPPSFTEIDSFIQSNLSE